MKLNLGCGRSRREGFVGVDIAPLDTVDVVHDLKVFPYPFADGSADEVLMQDVLEHLPDTIAVMEEVWRICRDGAKVHIAVPYYNSPGASQDPTHVRFFTENSFDYFTQDSSTPRSDYNYYSRARFRIIAVRPVQKKLLGLLPTRLQWLLAHHLATVRGLQIELLAVK